MKFALYSKSGEFVANVETGGAFTPDIIVWGQRYFYRIHDRGSDGPPPWNRPPSDKFVEAVLDTAVLCGSQEPPKR